ncbi:hypothetical protein MKZ07_23170 [Paenibacillus sp. FSL P4-0338]|uniref:hypothetical protein n=1 Tax=Paenibacillus sp. FSL P4-0338 TaxID=2921635 RepID=UPI0030FB11F7
MAIIRRSAQPEDNKCYQGEVDRVDYLPNTTTNFGTRDILRIVFKLDDRGMQTNVSERYNLPLIPESRLGRVITTLLGGIPEELDTDQLIGLSCRVLIEHRYLSDGNLWNGVKEVLPLLHATDNDTLEVIPAITNSVSPSTMDLSIPSIMKKTKVLPISGIKSALAKRSQIKSSSSFDAALLFESDESDELESNEE